MLPQEQPSDRQHALATDHAMRYAMISGADAACQVGDHAFARRHILSWGAARSCGAQC